MAFETASAALVTIDHLNRPKRRMPARPQATLACFFSATDLSDMKTRLLCSAHQKHFGFRSAVEELRSDQT
jgi:hypothetical protein